MEKEVILVAGLGYGDEGKGSIVDYLVRAKGAKLVVRYNGGAQAGHNVVTPDGREHTFSQFGSGTFVPGVKTHLSRFMLINPLSMLREEEHLQALGIRDAFQRITIEKDALVTTPFHIAANRLIEIWRGEEKHGSCGMGIGRTMDDFLRCRPDKILFAKDLRRPDFIERALRFLQKVNYNFLRDIIPYLPKTEVVERELEWLLDESIVNDLTKDYLDFGKRIKIVNESYLGKLLKGSSPVIFEGAQGLLIDKNYGFYPYVTKTDITFANAYTLLERAGYRRKITRIGVLRGYATRHGRGPFVTEDDGITEHLQDPRNPYNQWQEKLRFGWPDLLTAKYAIMINDSVDYIALTCLDQLAGLETIKVCVSYEYQRNLNVMDPHYFFETQKDLKILDTYFVWEPIDKMRAKILALKKADISSEKYYYDVFSRLLLQCKPLEFLEFEGWQEDISRIMRFEDLPNQAKKYIHFLESREGLNVPIKIISVNPTWEGKILVN